MMRGSHPKAPAPAQPRPIEIPPEPLAVRVAMAVKLTGLSRSRIYELIQSGDLPVRKVGRATLIAFADLKRLVTPEK